MTNEEELLKLYREYLHADDQFSGPRWWYMVNEDALAADFQFRELVRARIALADAGEGEIDT